MTSCARNSMFLTSFIQKEINNLLYKKNCLSIYIPKQTKNKQNSDWLNLYLVKTIYISFCPGKNTGLQNTDWSL